MLDDTFFVDEEKAAQGDGVVDEYAVVAGNLFGEVGYEWELYVADAAFVDGSVFPCEVREVGVDGAADEFAVAFFKGFNFFVECDDF